MARWGCVVSVLLVAAVPLCAGEEGLLAYYTFDEGPAATVVDHSGNGNTGQVHGAQFVPNGDGFALRFDGKDDYVDCGAPDSLSPTGAITLEAWVFPEAVPYTGEPGIIGKAYDSYVLTYYGDGCCWFYIGGGGNHTLARLAKDRWNHLVGAFDGQMLRLYVDGVLAGTRQSDTATIPAGGAFFMGKSSGDSVYTKGAHFTGRLDEVRIYDRALSADEVREHYRTTNLTREITLAPRLDYGSRKVLVSLDLRALGPLPAGTTIRVELRRPGSEKALTTIAVRPPAEGNTAEGELSVAGLEPGRYDVRAFAQDSQGKEFGKMSSASLTIPEPPSWPGNPAGVRVLNNLVSELLKFTGPKGPVERSLEFTNPREGWVFISSTAEVNGEGRVRVILEGGKRDRVIIHQPGGPSTLEAMRFLPEGRYTLSVACSRDAQLRQLVVRAIPELVYCQFGANPHVEPYGPYDWEFLSKHVLADCNLIVGTGNEEEKPYVQQWKAQGRHWLGYSGLPGLGEDQPVAAEAVEQEWTANPGYQDPVYDGIIVDEFGGGEYPQYAGWTEGLRRINANPRFAGRRFYAWCGPLYGAKPSEAFAQAVMDGGGRLVLERYLQEQPTEQSALAYLDQTLREPVAAWEAAQPGAVRHMVVCFGYLCAPNESLNVNPSVDWRVFMDMQVNWIANDPTFFGLHGVMWYLSSYCDEESLRWAARLYRHYCIEGRTDRLIRDPYVLTHIQNPDFAEGLSGWTATPAEEGSITTDTMPGWSWLEGRYPFTSQGDTFCLMKRSAKAPNVVSQTIKNLKPGRLYSLKMFSGDRQDLGTKKALAVSIDLQGVDLVPERCFDYVIGSCYAHTYGEFNADHPAWMTFHWRVFRAQGAEGTITLSDWAKPDDPGGPIGQETMLNFVEIEPYFEP
jgi:hypothetical protein